MENSGKIYDYVIVGGGICGCSIAFELAKKTSSILLIDKLNDVSMGASGAAGAFLSPLLGKPNRFKELITKSLIYSVDFYKQNTPKMISNCGTIRIPKSGDDEEKFQSYIPFMDFYFEPKKLDNGDMGYFFPIGSVVNSSGICQILSAGIQKLFNYEVKKIIFDGEKWILNDQIFGKNLILTTGADTKLIAEKYVDIRAVWGQRIDIETSNCISVNYHKECSISRTTEGNGGVNMCSIGATHHRFEENRECSDEDSKELLSKANEIIKLNNVKVVATFGGARASSSDYFPIVGDLVSSYETIERFPYLKNGTNVNSSRFIRYQNLFILNGVGGRGFVLAPYLAKILASNILGDEPICESVSTDRLFKRWVKRG